MILLLSALWGANVVAVKVGLEDAPRSRSRGCASSSAASVIAHFLVPGDRLTAAELGGVLPLSAFLLALRLFGVLATAVILREPITWTLALATLLLPAGIAVATMRSEGAG